MARILLCALVPCALAAAQGDYDRLLAEAAQLQDEVRPGEQPDLPLNRAYEKLAEAAQLAPQRWEAFALRGANRCMKAVVCRRILAERLNEDRVRGSPADEIAVRQEAGLVFIDQCIAEARHDFAVMERLMRAGRSLDPQLVRFASAAIKYARAQYEEAEPGEPGAIDDFKALVRQGWRVRHCSEFVARCYLEVGAVAYTQVDFASARDRWEEGLRWAQTDATKRMLVTNIAGAYVADTEYGRAKEVLRSQIEREPHRPEHWKNLGLILGYENRIREAAHAYGQARELCLRAKEAPFFPGLLHGNAWLKGAMIHGKLLEDDGDLMLAWRLFLEYRAMFGDDYNFCLNFGDFALHLKQYDLAWIYIGHARDLRPFCPSPYQLLLQIAPRLPGTPEEVRARVKEAKEAQKQAQERFPLRSEVELSVLRLCGGLRDRLDALRFEGRAPLLDPDPLSGFGPAEPPSWIVDLSLRRAPFRPFDPARDRDEGSEPEPEDGAEPSDDGRPRLLWLVIGAAVLVLAAVSLLVVRRR